jgi:hypothetical protein
VLTGRTLLNDASLSLRLLSLPPLLFCLHVLQILRITNKLEFSETPELDAVVHPATRQEYDLEISADAQQRHYDADIQFHIAETSKLFWRRDEVREPEVFDECGEGVLGCAISDGKERMCVYRGRNMSLTGFLIGVSTSGEGTVV